jgi:hypothetical protein
MSLTSDPAAVKSGTPKPSPRSITALFTAVIVSSGILGVSARAQELVSPLPYPPIASDRTHTPEHQLQARLLVNDSQAPNLAERAQTTPAHEESITETTAATKALNFPYGVAVDTAGNLYVANLFGNNVTVYNKSLQLIATITGGMNFPAAVAVAFGGNIYVANNGGNNITIYSPQYEQIGAITDSTLISPSSMYIDKNNDIWVLDALGTVHLYLDNGTPISSQALGSGTAIGPWGSNVTVWGVTNPNGVVELSQNMGEAVHSGVAFPIAYPESPVAGGEAQDALGNQYVTNPSSNQIIFFTANGLGYGVFLTTTGPAYGIAVDSINNRIYVAETTLGKVQAYNLTDRAKTGTIE